MEFNLNERPRRCRYTRLEKPNLIRVLHLYPASDDEELEGELVIESLDDEPEYKAISYVWGEPILNCRLYTLDKNWYPITESLWNALRDIRSTNDKEEPYIALWADYLCMNQDDIFEKEQQVRLMGRIYHQASFVITYIGPATDLTPKGIALAFRLWSWMKDNTTAGDPRNAWNSDTLDEIIQKASLPSKTDDSWKGMNDLFNRTWSTRIWIVQESLLNKTMWMLCGTFIFPFWNLLPTLAYMLSFGFRSAEFIRLCFGQHVRSVERMENCWKLQIIHSIRNELTGSRSLQECLRYCHDLAALDPRDKVFALLSLAEKTFEIVPDYRKSCEQVYIETALALLKEYNDFQFLSSVYMDKSLRLPSWVPDWSHPCYIPGRHSGALHSVRRTLYRACGNTTPVYTVGARLGALKIRCMQVDQLKSASKRVKEEALEFAEQTCILLGGCTRLSHWQRHVVREAAKVRKQYPAGGSYCEATRRTLYPNQVQNIQIADEEAPQMINRVLDHWENHNDTAFPSELKHIAATLDARFQHYTANRVFYETEHGYIGLGPLGALKGDILAVFYGGRVPYILRRNEHGDGWKFIGETYVHGLMHGEAFEIGCHEEDIWLV